MRKIGLSAAASDRAAVERFLSAQAEDNGAQHARFRAAFARALREELTARQLEALRLSYFEGLSGRAIAAQWGVSPSAVSRHLARAKRRLHHLLAYNLEWRGE